MNTVLIVCFANICRSPAASVLLSQQLRERGLGTCCASAGTHAIEGAEADAVMQRALTERGCDVFQHRARQLTGSLIHTSELVLTMETSHRREIEQRWPESRGRVFLLGHWNRSEIADPHGMDLPAYRSALDLIDACVTSWAQRL